MVVSDMKERLSPKNAPPAIIATIKGISTPIFSAIPTATGIRATIVPTDVPIDRDMKHAAMNIPANNRLLGSICSVRFTVASMAPMLLADWANAPAKIKIQIINIIFPFEAPAEKCTIRSFNVLPRDIRIEKADDIRKATVIGTL